MKTLQILLVEDEAINAFYLKELMKRKGHNIIDVADNGKDAIDKALNTFPDLIIMDIRLKDEIDGIQAVTEIHKIRFIPVIYITASNDRETYKKAVKTKMVAFMTKPIDEKELDTHLASLLNIHV